MKKIEIARELVNAINENNKLSGNHIYTKDGWEEYFKFQANVCSMGEFEIDGNAKQEFYIGFGQFLASEKVNGELKNELKLFTDNIREARKAYKEKKEAYINK